MVAEAVTVPEGNAGRKSENPWALEFAVASSALLQFHPLWSQVLPHPSLDHLQSKQPTLAFNRPACSYCQSGYVLLLKPAMPGYLWIRGENRQRWRLLWFLQCLVLVWFNFSRIHLQTLQKAFDFHFYFSNVLFGPSLSFFQKLDPSIFVWKWMFCTSYCNIYRQHLDLTSPIHTTPKDKPCASPGCLLQQKPLLQLESRSRESCFFGKTILPLSNLTLIDFDLHLVVADYVDPCESLWLRTFFNSVILLSLELSSSESTLLRCHPISMR